MESKIESIRGLLDRRSFSIVQKEGDSLSNLISGTYSEEEKRMLLELPEEIVAFFFSLSRDRKLSSD